jgi:hypothetical protein
VITKILTKITFLEGCSPLEGGFNIYGAVAAEPKPQYVESEKGKVLLPTEPEVRV